MIHKDIINVLATHHLRLTNPRRELLQLFSNSHRPLSTTDLFQSLRTMERSTIYRNLEALEAVGVIKSNTIKWKRHYELSEPFLHHHHHIVCTECNAIKDFDSKKLEAFLADIATDNSFQLSSHLIELNGICSLCQSKLNLRSNNT